MYTKQDLANIEEAIAKLQSGTRVVSVSYGDHVVKYADVNLTELLGLRNSIKKELKLGNKLGTGLRKMNFSTHKGIG
jgi:20S proteasome alpha/beta subunit